LVTESGLSVKNTQHHKQPIEIQNIQQHHISNTSLGNSTEPEHQVLPDRASGRKEKVTMKRVIRLFLALLFLGVSCSTPLFADGSNPPPKCTPKTCPAVR
jgi:hypothetical protein